MTLFDQIFTLLATGAAFAFVLVLVGYMYKRDAIHWQYLAGAYGRPWQRPLAERWGNAVLYGKYPVSKAYNGSLKIGIHADGVALRVMFPPHAFFCKPLFVPFSDIRGWDQTWYLNAATMELELDRAPEVKIVMPREQLDWIRSMGGEDIEVTGQPSPHNDKPYLWHAYIVASSAVFVFVTLYLVLPENLF